MLRGFYARIGTEWPVHGTFRNLGDYDNDGELDLYLAKAYGISQFKFSANILLRNNGDGTFAIIPIRLETSLSRSSRDATWLEFDNDGELELYVVNSRSMLSFLPRCFHPLLDTWLLLLEWNCFDQANILFENLADGTFADVTDRAGVRGRDSNSEVGAGDFDGDGFIDLFLASGYYPLETGPLIAYRNSGNSNHWLGLRLVGRKSNRSAIGSKVVLKSGKRRQFRGLNGGVHGFSQDGPIVHFGLSDEDTVSRLEITWPSGIKTNPKISKVDQVVTTLEPSI